MKVEIDLNDILGDEYGTETIEESVRRQVIDFLTNDFKQRVGRALDRDITERVNKIMDEQLEARFPTMIEELWNMEYKPVTRYGQEDKQSTTLKNELLETISKQLVYKSTGFNSDKNPFTKAVDASVEKGMRSFKKDFDETVTKELKKQAFAYALKQLDK